MPIVVTEARAAGRTTATQRGRARAELAPGFVALDERGTAELLAYARLLAPGIAFYDADNDPVAGGWSGLLRGIGGDGGPSLAEAAAFAANPEAYPDARFAPLRRPHVALFLTFLRLFRHAQDAQNQLLARDLEHQLRTVLGLRPLPPVPDRVFVLFDRTAGVSAAEVPAGQILSGGRDLQRRDQLFALDRALVVTPAKVAEVRSVFVDRDVIGIADARDAVAGSDERRGDFLLAVALGDPSPGDPPVMLDGKPLGWARLPALATLARFAPERVGLTLDELRAMLATLAVARGSDATWATINDLLRTAAVARAGRRTPAWDGSRPHDFTFNLEQALGPESVLIGGLPEIDRIEDVALHLDDPAIADEVPKRFFMSVESFATIMRLQRGLDRQWGIVNTYLDRAGKRLKGAAFTLAPKDPAAFEANLATAAGTIDFAAAGEARSGAADLGSYLARVDAVVAATFLTPDDWLTLSAAGTAAAAWPRAYAALGAAHARQVLGRARARIAALRTTAGLAAAVEDAVGAAADDAGSPIDLLARYAGETGAAAIRAALVSAPDDWSRIDAILAAAARRRLGLGEPVARLERCRGLRIAADATQVPGNAGAPAWRPFGAGGKGEPPIVPAIGIAVASAALALSAGQRRIMVRLEFDIGQNPSPLAAPRPFEVAISVDGGWHAPADVAFADLTVATGRPSLRALTVTIDLAPDDPAPAPPDDAAGAAGLPVVRLLLAAGESGGRAQAPYARLRAIRLLRVAIEVGVGSLAKPGGPPLSPVSVETDAGSVDARKPFEPYGHAPAPGSELALGHPDLLGKQLTRVRLGWQWQGAPKSLDDWYKAYALPQFLADVAIVDRGSRRLPLGAPEPLFAGGRGDAPVTVERQLVPPLAADTNVGSTGGGTRSWRRYLTVTLAGTGFGHADYPSLAARRSIDLAQAISQKATIDAAAFVVNPPYTPRMKQPWIEFTAAHEFVLDAAPGSDPGTERIYHVHPFGYDRLAPRPGGWAVLPDYDCEGALYVGLDGVAAPQSLSLLAALGAGLGSDTAARWSYLDAGGWRDLPTPPDDGSAGLNRAGVIRFALPAASPNELMPAGRYWLRATVDRGAAEAPDLLGLHANAAVAVRAGDTGDSGAGLPAGSIRTVVQPPSGIARVRQPYSGFGGRRAEDEAAFRTRAGERQRHRNRAVAPWDYERLALAEFPELRAVKCLPAGAAEAPGMVRLVVLPMLVAGADDPLRPRLPAALLDEIGTRIARRAPGGASVRAVNPRYVPLRVRVGVRFVDGGNAAFDRTRLGAALDRFLAPWAYDADVDVPIGRPVAADGLVAFIDALPFVAFVGGIRLFTLADDGQFRVAGDGGQHADPGGEDAMLTAGGAHEIDAIADDLFEPVLFRGIGFMRVDLDFELQ